MKASTERKLLRWIHIVTGIPVIGFIYGPVAQMPESAMAVKAGFFPRARTLGIVAVERLSGEELVSQN